MVDYVENGVEVGDKARAEVIVVGGGFVVLDEGWASWEIRRVAAMDGRRNVSGGERRKSGCDAIGDEVHTRGRRSNQLCRWRGK